MKWYYKLGFALVYTLGYFFLTFLAGGAGHGTFIFLGPVITWFFVFIAIYLSTNAGTLLKRVFFVISLLMHYAYILFFLRPFFFGEIDPGTSQVWNNDPQIIIQTTAWYFVGQLAIWLMFFRTIRKSKATL